MKGEWCVNREVSEISLLGCTETSDGDSQVQITDRRIAESEDGRCNGPGVQQAQSVQPASRPTGPELGGGQESR